MELINNQPGGEQWWSSEEEVGGKVEVWGSEWMEVERVVQMGKLKENAGGLRVGSGVGSMHGSGSGMGVKAVTVGQLMTSGHLRAN